MMSCYNGERYIDEQIKSIFSQKNVKVTLYIRDDGSRDHTLAVVRKMQKVFPDDIVLFEGENINFQRSFCELLKNVPCTYDFYAFSDQDDVWKENKLGRAISHLKDEKLPALYVANPEYVDEKLQEYDRTPLYIDNGIKEGIVSAKTALAFGICGLGCTMVWNNKFQTILHNAEYSAIPVGHDNLLSMLAPLCGTLYKDPEKVLLYRQHNHQASQKHEKRSFYQKVLQHTRNFCNPREFLARKFIWTQFANNLSDEGKKQLDMSIHYRKSFISTIKFVLQNYAAELDWKQQVKFILRVVLKKY